ncbi:MAG: hypothetical protein PHS79_05565 [Patescibacteria group bacterium]|nr:hypothetical protein [Patescibacteria group bacterium]
MRHQHLFFVLLIATFLAAGCNQPVTVPHVAETLGPSEVGGAPSQNGGFGVLPKINFQTNDSSDIVNIETDLPTIQPTVTVVRLPAGDLNLTEFQNLTQAIGLPAGLVGDDTRNLGYALTWTNKESAVWKYYSLDHKLTFTNDTTKPKNPIVNSWMGNEQLIDKVDVFLKLRGINEQLLKNIQIAPAWSAWLDKLDRLQGCAPTDVRNQIVALQTSDQMFDKAPPALPEVPTTGCVASYPSILPVSFERLVDGWNIVNKDGQPELGGQILVNSQTGEMVSGWMTFPDEPQRSDYAAIDTATLQSLLERGGLAGDLPGYKQITDISFAFVRLSKTQTYDYSYLVPAAVAEAVRSTNLGPQRYRIVVPLIKQ